MHFTHTPIRPLSPPTPTKQKSRAKGRGLTKVLERVNKILNPLSSTNQSNIPIQELLTFKASKDNYLSQTLPLITKPKLERTSLDLLLISGYFTYLPEFTSIIKHCYHDKSKDILKQIADIMNYIQYDPNELILRNGDESKLFYLILKGSVDILSKKRFKDNITINEYYRYLALLIGYNEIDIVNRVINENKDIIGIEIADSNGYGKVDMYRNRIKDKIYRQVTLEELFRMLSIKEWEEMNALGHVYVDINTGRVNAFNDWYDVDNPARNGVSYNRFRNKKIQISTEDYINRIMKYKTNHLSHHKHNKDNKLYQLNLYRYIQITRLLCGQHFGEFSLNDPYYIRTFSAISNTSVHLGTFTKANYMSFLKDPIEKTKKQYMVFILSTYIFKNYSLVLLQKKYFNNFIITKIEKNTYPLIENTPINQIYLFKEGTYESSITTSLSFLGDIINALFEKVKDVMRNNNTNIPNEQVKDEVFVLYEKIKQMRYENERIEQMGKDIVMLRKFYYDKKEFKIYSTDTPDLCGFKNLCMDDNVNIFSVKCVSKIGEYLVLNMDVYNDMKGNDYEVRRLEKEYCYTKNYKMIKRLLDIRKIKIQTFIEHNKINNILNLKGYIDPYQQSYFSRELNLNNKGSNGNDANGISIHKCLSLSKTRVSSPIHLQQCIHSVRNIKSSNPSYKCKNKRNLFNSFNNNNTLTSNTSKKAFLSNSNNHKHSASLQHNSNNCISSPLLSHTSIVSDNSNSNHNNKIQSKNHRNFLLQNDMILYSPNNKIFQITKYNLFRQFRHNKKKYHTSYSSFWSLPSASCGKEKCVHINKSSKCLAKNEDDMSKTRRGSQLGSKETKRGMNNNNDDVNNNCNVLFDNSVDIVFNHNKSCEYINGNGFEDFQLKKKEKYMENRKVYLMKNTRDFFLRYKDKLKMRKRKKK